MLWLKSFHIIAMTCWFAGLFYLPRLFVYHAMSEDETSNERFKIMERKLYRGIMNPSMIATLALGLWMLVENWSYYSGQMWMHIKLALVIILLGYHFMCRHLLGQFQQDNNRKSHIYFRWFNEFPVLLLIAIVILVVVRPL